MAVGLKAQDALARYPFVDSMLLALGVQQKLLRYRIHMSHPGCTWTNTVTLGTL